MKDFGESLFVAFILGFIIMGTIGGFVLLGMFVSNYTPTHKTIKYGEYVCIVDKDWGFIKENKTCYLLKK